MLRGLRNVLFCFCVVIAVARPVCAIQTGSILVETQGGAVALYRVGAVNGQSFLLEEAFGGGLVNLEDTLSPNLAQWLLGQAKTGSIKAPDICGKVLFSDLEPGLYLLAQRTAPAGSAPFAPVLLPIPWDGELWDVSIAPDLQNQPPVTEDSFHSASWVLGMFLSALGLLACIRHGKQLTESCFQPHRADNRKWSSQ